MKYKLQDLIDIEQFQNLQDQLNKIYAFPSAIIDNDGNILTATAWQDICTQFHRKNQDCARDCLHSDQYILSHLHEANPAVSYLCPRGMVDNATPIIIDGVHYGNFFTGQFFLEKPDLEFYRMQAKQFGFDEETYLAAVNKVPIWTREQLNSYLFFIKGLIAVISESGLKRLKEMQARKQVEATEERANAILHQMHDGFWAVSPQGGKIVDVNDAMCQMLGYTRDELLKMSVSDVTVDYSPEMVAQSIQNIVQTGSVNFESRFRRKDGTIFDIEVGITYIPKHDLFFSFHRDISERKRAELALADEATRRRILMEQSKDGIVILDQNGHVYESNQKFADMLGYSLEEMHQRAVFDWEFLYPRERVAEMIRTVDEKGDHFETKHRRKDGSVYDVEISTNATRFAGQKLIFCVCRDITERKRAEEALRESEVRFRSIINSSPVPIGMNDANLNITLINPAFTQAYGYTVQDLPTVNDWWIKAYPEVEYRQKISILWFERMEQAQRTGVFEPIEADIRCKDDSVRTVLSTASIMGYSGETIIINYDITERKRTEEALRESENRFASAFEHAAIGMALVSPEGLFLKANHSLCELLGYSESELLAKTFQNITYPDDLEMDLHNVRQMLAGEIRTYQMEKRYYHKTGHLVWALLSVSLVQNEQGKPLYFISQIENITERKRAEEALRASNAKLETLVHVSPLAIYLTDTDENIQLWNTAAEKIFGWTTEEVIGHPNPSIPADKQNEFVTWRKQILDGKAVTNQESIRQRKDGSRVDVDISSAPIYDAAGNSAGRMAIVADITEQKKQQQQIFATQIELQQLLDESDKSRRVLLSVVEDQREAEEALRQLNAELEQRVAERTAQLQAANQELEAFAYSVSHDLRTPLRAIDGYSRILLEDYADKLDAEAVRLFNVVRANTQKMDHLITDLLMLSRTTRGEMNLAQIDMSALAQAVYDEIIPSETQAQVTLKIAPLSPAHGDAALMRQVWSNLLINAVKFTQPKAERRIEIDSYVQDRQNVYSVKDNGVGFNPDYTNKLFGVFQRLHKANEFEGTGVGLAIVQRIVHRHGGRVWAEGQLGQGATFYFSIPSREANSEHGV